MRKIFYSVMTLENLAKEKYRIQRNYSSCLEARNNLVLIKGRLLKEQFGPFSQNAQNRINRNIDSILEVIEPYMVKQEIHIDNLMKVILTEDSSGLTKKTLNALTSY